jgi:hypothetical protein
MAGRLELEHSIANLDDLGKTDRREAASGGRKRWLGHLKRVRFSTILK